jgi:hypothetical protein
MYVSSNGFGMGHLTRLMAMARRRGPAVSPYVVSMSRAVPVVGEQGLDYEYVPSRDDLGIGARRWRALFVERFAEVLLRERPDVVVFDGVHPYEGVLRSRDVLPDVAMVWSRRAMWRKGLGHRQLESSGVFDLVIEPGELAASMDAGATVGRTDALPVGPVTLLDDADLLPREQAAAALGVDPDRPTALVTLGVGSIKDVESEVGRVVRGLTSVPGLQVVVTRPAIAARGGDLPGGVVGVSLYPIARHLRAVDLAVTAAGYNSFHEMVGHGVPSAFVANRTTGRDDQPARARWAEHAGVGLDVPVLDAAGVERVVRELGDPGVRARMRSALAAVRQPNGAADAQAAVERLLPSGELA